MHAINIVCYAVSKAQCYVSDKKQNNIKRKDLMRCRNSQTERKSTSGFQNEAKKSQINNLMFAMKYFG